MTTALLDGGRRQEPPTLAVVIVNFNSWPDTGRLVESLAVAGGLDRGLPECEVIVVDNASDDPEPACLADRAGVRVIRRPDNAGFAAGVNTAWRAATARWLLLLNPDVDAEPGLVASVLDRIAHYERRPAGVPGLVGFALRNADGTRQHSVGSFPSLAGCLLEMARPRSRRKYWPLRRTRPGPVPWATGACLLVRSSVLDDVGGMDEEFFLYYEEVAFCRSARDRGHAIEFDDAVAVRHLTPLQSREVSPSLRVVTRHSKLLYFLKYRPRWEFRCLARIVAAEAWCRCLASRALGKVPEARAWRAIGRIARGLDHGRGPRGVEVLGLAERAVEPGGSGPKGTRPAGRPHPDAARPIPLDGLARSR